MLSLKLDAIKNVSQLLSNRHKQYTKFGNKNKSNKSKNIMNESSENRSISRESNDRKISICESCQSTF